MEGDSKNAFVPDRQVNASNDISIEGSNEKVLQQHFVNWQHEDYRQNSPTFIHKDFDLSKLKNPERKRFREKRRRERVNESYEKLKSSLIKVDSQRYFNQGGSNDMSQVEIVNSAITVIHQLLDENKVARRKILELQSAHYHEHNLEQIQANMMHNQNLEREIVAEQNRESHFSHGHVPAFVNPFEHESFSASPPQSQPQISPISHSAFDSAKASISYQLISIPRQQEQPSQSEIHHSSVNFQQRVGEPWIELIKEASSFGRVDECLPSSNTNNR